jgi:hypothetical protein
MGIAEFIIGPAEGRTRWLHPSYDCTGWFAEAMTIPREPRSERLPGYAHSSLKIA